MFDDFLSYFSTEVKSVSFNYKDCSPEDLFYICDEYLNPYLSYIKDNKEVFGTVLLRSGIFRFDDIYKLMFEKIFNPILERFNYPESSRKYVMCYYLNGINAIVMAWLKDGCSKSIKEISEIITICIYGLKKQLIKNEQYQKEM